MFLFLSNSCQKNSFPDDTSSSIEEKGGGKKKKKKKSEAAKRMKSLKDFLIEKGLGEYVELLESCKLLSTIERHQGTVFVPNNNSIQILKGLSPKEREYHILSHITRDVVPRISDKVTSILFKSILSLPCVDSDGESEYCPIEMIVSYRDQGMDFNLLTSIKPDFYEFESKTFYLACDERPLFPLLMKNVISGIARISSYFELVNFSVENKIPLHSPKADILFGAMLQRESTSFLIPVNSIYPKSMTVEQLKTSCDKVKQVRDFISFRTLNGKILDTENLKTPVELSHFNPECRCRISFEMKDKSKPIESRIKFSLKREGECKHTEELSGTILFFIRTSASRGSIIIYE